MENQFYGDSELKQERKIGCFIWETNTQNSNSVLSSKIIRNEEFCWQVRGMLDQLTLEMH